MFAVFDVIRKRDFGDAVSEEKVLKLVLENHVLVRWKWRLEIAP